MRFFLFSPFKKLMIIYRILIQFFIVLIRIIQISRKSKKELILENLALRQQLSTYQVKKSRPKLSNLDRSFWIALKLSWCKWVDHLIIVKPETAIGWQNRRFRKYCKKFQLKIKSPEERELNRKSGI